jgi:hypothetical protein
VGGERASLPLGHRRDIVGPWVARPILAPFARWLRAERRNVVVELSPRLSSA